MGKLINFLLFFISFTLILHFVGVIDLRKIFKKREHSLTYGLTREEKARKINAYFASFDAPVTGYGMEFVLASERYKIDWRLLPSICRQESGGGRYPYNGDPHNILGYKIRGDIRSIKEAVNLSAKSISGQGKVTYLLYRGKSLRGRLAVYSGREAGYSDKIFYFMYEIHNDGKPIN